MKSQSRLSLRSKRLLDCGDRVEKSALLMLGFLVALLSGCNAPVNISSSQSHYEMVLKDPARHVHLIAVNATMPRPLGSGIVGAVYMTLENKGADDRLVSVACDCSASATLHTMSMQGDMMQMREVKDGFEIKSGESLVLNQGGNHIMLEGIKPETAKALTVTLSLNFEKAGKMTVFVPIIDPKPQ